MNRYLLVIILLCALALTGVPTAQATTPRVHALGGAGDYFEDDSGTLRWFGSLGDYGNAVTLDFGHFNIYKGYHDDRGNTFSGPSLSVRQSLGARWGMFAAIWNAVDDDVPSPSLYRDFREDSFSLMYGRRIGAVQLGLVYQNSPQQETQEINLLRRTERHLWGLGARFDVSPRAYIDLATELRFNHEVLLVDNDPVHPQSSDLESDAGVNLRGRLFLQLGDRTALVPVVEYLSENRPKRRQLVAYTQRVNGHALHLGCGLNFFPDTDRFWYLAADLIHGNIDYLQPEYHAAWNAWSLQTGWEYRYGPWVTLRSSVGYRLIRGDGAPGLESEENAQSYNSDDLQFTLGAGFHLGNWDLDAALSETEPRPVYGTWEWWQYAYDTTWLSVSLRYRLP